MPRVVPQYTIQNPTISDVAYIRFTRERDDQGVMGTVAHAQYTLKDESGNAVSSGSVSIRLTNPQQTALGNFITSNIPPEIIAQENL